MVAAPETRTGGVATGEEEGWGGGAGGRRGKRKGRQRMPLCKPQAEPQIWGPIPIKPSSAVC